MTLDELLRGPFGLKYELIHVPAMVPFSYEVARLFLSLCGPFTLPLMGLTDAVGLLVGRMPTTECQRQSGLISVVIGRLNIVVGPDGSTAQRESPCETLSGPNRPISLVCLSYCSA